MNSVISEIPAILIAGGRPMEGGAMIRIMASALDNAKGFRVSYIGAANGDNFAFFTLMKSMLVKAGAGKIDFIKLTKKKVDVSVAREMLERADAVFISGGEVEDGMNGLKKHGLDGFLKDLYAGGKRFICTSAGAIMMGTRWVRWENPSDDSTAELFDCLGIIPAVFDTHAEDEDWIELKTVLRLMGDGSRGYGLPRGSIISADSSGAFVNFNGAPMTFINNNGEYKII